MGASFPKPKHPENYIFFLAVVFEKIVELQHFSPPFLNSKPSYILLLLSFKYMA